MMNAVQRYSMRRSQTWACAAAMVVFLIYTLVSFGTYTARTLKGEIGNHILAAEMFGTPAALKERGIKPLFTGAGVTGWDGQFYYYMSNDVLARKDTASHIDAPSYRYQRVGLSLYVKTMSVLTGREWVSPQFFFISYFLLVASATLAGARLLARFGGNPLLILFWSLSTGTQITLFNALPDASADAFLILALAALFSGRTALSALPFALSALSREVYALFPALILLFALFDSVRLRRTTQSASWGTALAGTLRQPQREWWLLVPCLVVVAWQAYVVHHFGVKPSDQAAGILGAPFASWYDYLISSLRGNHLLMGPGPGCLAEAVSLSLFALVLAAAFLTGARLLLPRQPQTLPAPVRGIAATVVLFAALYACFGPTVMMHYSGYFKASAVFFFLLPLLSQAAPPRRLALKYVVYVLLLGALVATSIYNMAVRILPYRTYGEAFARMSAVTETRAFECFGTYGAKIKVNSIMVDEGTWITRLFGRGHMVVNLDLTNTTSHTFTSTKGFGSVFMSYHWVDEKNQAVVDGERSALPKPVLPGETVNVSVYSTYPKAEVPLSLKLSPVQEGCTWFYLANPSVTDGFSYILKH